MINFGCFACCFFLSFCQLLRWVWNSANNSLICGVSASSTFWLSREIQVLPSHGQGAIIHIFRTGSHPSQECRICRPTLFSMGRGWEFPVKLTWFLLFITPAHTMYGSQCSLRCTPSDLFRDLLPEPPPNVGACRFQSFIPVRILLGFFSYVSIWWSRRPTVWERERYASNWMREKYWGKSGSLKHVKGICEKMVKGRQRGSHEGRTNWS